jgi:hypothetical protein
VVVRAIPQCVSNIATTIWVLRIPIFFFLFVFIENWKISLYVTAPRHKWRGFTGSEDPGLDNHREMPVEAADF